MTERIAIVGLGYVGLPLAVELARHFDVLGQDIDEARISELSRGHDRTDAVDTVTLTSADIRYTQHPDELFDRTFYVIAVPTPIHHNGAPDLTAIRSASLAVGKTLRPGDVVVYECTVYPGLTEDQCAGWLERASGLRVGIDLGLGYSPERINPGDRTHTLRNIPKIISASDPQTLDRMRGVYAAIVEVPLHLAPNIRTAEACKVIENAQRNVNIAFMNEVACLLDGIDISTRDVMDAMATKWNHLPFHPGLVGGHCIGVDPYYLVACAENAGSPMPLLQQALRTNNEYATQLAKQLERRMGGLQGRRVAVLGLPYKPDVLDLRNTRVPELCERIVDLGADVMLHDPLIDPLVARSELGVTLVPSHRLHDLDAVVLAVPHKFWRDDPTAIANMLRPNGLIFDPHKKLRLERVPQGLRYAAV
ncbi:MAG: UDP-N-acetyl-D-galactosamine dehydrogenase [Kiritimatiellia bacterium]|jgi:UDP-N-acetyl-D-galactosamine dehydrogenase